MRSLMDADSPLVRFGAVIRANHASRVRDRREYWSVSEWRLFLGEAIPCGMKFPRLVALLKRGATAEEIALEFGTDEVQARIRLRDRAEQEAASIRREAGQTQVNGTNVRPLRRASVERDDTEGFVVL